MATVSIDYFGMNGIGRNVTEAKRDAGRKLEQAMNGNYEPRVIASRGVAMLIWRDPQGWRSSTITDTDSGDDKGSKTGFRERLSYSSGDSDFYAVYASALAHLAQMTWDGKEIRPPCLDEVSTINSRHNVNDNAGRRLLADFASWRGFQLAFRHAKDNGIGTDHNEWHRYGCEHSSEFAAA